MRNQFRLAIALASLVLRSSNGLSDELEIASLGQARVVPLVRVVSATEARPVVLLAGVEILSGRVTLNDPFLAQLGQRFATLQLFQRSPGRTVPLLTTELTRPDRQPEVTVFGAGVFVGRLLTIDGTGSSAEDCDLEFVLFEGFGQEGTAEEQSKLSPLLDPAAFSASVKLKIAVEEVQLHDISASDKNEIGNISVLTHVESPRIAGEHAELQVLYANSGAEATSVFDPAFRYWNLLSHHPVEINVRGYDEDQQHFCPVGKYVAGKSWSPDAGMYWELGPGWVAGKRLVMQQIKVPGRYAFEVTFHQSVLKEYSHLLEKDSFLPLQGETLYRQLVEFTVRQ